MNTEKPNIMKRTIEMTEQELKDLKLIRNYFGEHDKTPFEHLAYSEIGKLVKKLQQGQCKDCKHWSKYSDGSMKCSFYPSMPRTSDGDKSCDMDLGKKFGFESLNDNTEKPIQPTLDKKLFRQWLIGVLAEGKSFTKDNALKSVNKANEIIDFMEKHGIINPLIK